MLVATFGPTTSWLGRTVTFENDTFFLQDHGPISATDVMHYDQQGHLVWASERTRAWVGCEVASGGKKHPTKTTTPIATEWRLTTESPKALSPSDPYDVIYHGGHPAYPETNYIGGIDLLLFNNRFEFRPSRTLQEVVRRIDHSIQRGS